MSLTSVKTFGPHNNSPPAKQAKQAQLGNRQNHYAKSIFL